MPNHVLGREISQRSSEDFPELLPRVVESSLSSLLDGVHRQQCSKKSQVSGTANLGTYHRLPLWKGDRSSQEAVGHLPQGLSTYHCGRFVRPCARANRELTHNLSDEQMLERLRPPLTRHGKLSNKIIDKSRTCPGVSLLFRSQISTRHSIANSGLHPYCKGVGELLTIRHSDTQEPDITYLNSLVAGRCTLGPILSWLFRAYVILVTAFTFFRPSFMGTNRPNGEVHQADTFGVLKLTLHPVGYGWEFIPEAGKTFKDSEAGAYR